MPRSGRLARQRAVVESPTQAAAEQFAAPFAGVGSIQVTMGLTCEEVAKSCLGEWPAPSPN